MTPFEWTYMGLRPFLPTLYTEVREHLFAAARATPGRMQLLDVGGRKSHYTIGLPADITVSDLPRESAIQHEMRLGLDEAALRALKTRRTNVVAVQLDDMTRSRLPDAHFDCVVAVEVLEHVEEDAAFVHHVRRVLKPGGRFVMTTPNGDHNPHPTHDHKRHYRREQLRDLLARELVDVDVHYAVAAGRARQLGLWGWGLRRPIKTVLSMAGNFVNALESRAPEVRERALGTHHLVAVARRAR